MKKFISVFAVLAAMFVTSCANNNKKNVSEVEEQVADTTEVVTTIDTTEVVQVVEAQ